MDYSGTIRRAWEIVWKNKWLWLLAVLPLPNPLSLTRLAMTISVWPIASPATSWFLNLESTPVYAGPVILRSFLTVLVPLAVLVVSLVTHGVLISAVAQRAGGETTSFSHSFNDALRRLVPLLGATILLYALPAIVFFVSVSLGNSPFSMMANTSPYQTMWLDISENDRTFARFLTVALVVASLFLYLFAIRGIILHRLSAMKGIGHGLSLIHI